jgi:hypothetical protein
MSNWTPCPAPSALVEQVDTREVEESDGRKTLVFATKNGVRFVRITEPAGFVFWMREVKSNA